MTDEELIRQVAEEVMGWDPIPFFSDFNPLINLNHAFMVVERMRELGFTLKLGYGETIQGVLAWVRFTPESWSSYYHHKQIGHAICEAALKAVRHG